DARGRLRPSPRLHQENGVALRHQLPHRQEPAERDRRRARQELRGAIPECRGAPAAGTRRDHRRRSAGPDRITHGGIPMSTERKQVLDMLAEGKISTADADRLLDKLEGSERPSASAGASTATRSLPAGAPKFLRVVVDSNDGDVVNIRVPLFLVRTGIRLSTMLPSKVSRRLDEKGIDLSQLSGLEGEELVQAL